MAREGWQPALHLWNEPGNTLLSGLSPVYITLAASAGPDLIKYTCLGKDLDSVVGELTAQGYNVARVCYPTGHR
ncbi:hypothetical protein WJX73_000175 [Symbiochloris irregularis]|uniref:Uncharacterized protein n=1 Tax=Symbiochloris irregularis TaxID=706552 RepID=A0AAW1NX62_9CHLO